MRPLLIAWVLLATASLAALVVGLARLGRRHPPGTPAAEAAWPTPGMVIGWSILGLCLAVVVAFLSFWAECVGEC